MNVTNYNRVLIQLQQNILFYSLLCANAYCASAEGSSAVYSLYASYYLLSLSVPFQLWCRELVCVIDLEGVMEYLDYLDYLPFYPPWVNIDRKHKPFDDSKDRVFQNVFQFSKKNTEELITKRLQRSSDPRDSQCDSNLQTGIGSFTAFCRWKLTIAEKQVVY